MMLAAHVQVLLGGAPVRMGNKATAQHPTHRGDVLPSMTVSVSSYGETGLPCFSSFVIV